MTAPPRVRPISMPFESFVAREQVSWHQRRLAASSLLSAGLLAAALAVASRGSTSEAPPRPAETIDEVLDVKLASKPAAPEPAPVAAPAPAALVPRTVKINPDAPPPRPLEAPREVPKEKPREADPSQDRGVSGVHEGGDVAGRGAGTRGTGTAPPAPAPTPTPTPSAPPPPPPRVTTISEDTEPPVPVAQPRPQPPAEFVAAGEDAVVVVKFEVTEAGDVTNVRIVKGHPLLDAAVLAAVRTWRFKPAMSQGKPVAYPKTVKLPFRIRT